MNQRTASPTLPISWYVDPAVLAAELQAVFADAPGYVGCLPLVAGHGCYRTVAERDHGEVLVRDGDQLRLLSNVCLLRGMQLAAGSGCAKALVCSMHRWSYGLDGRLLKAPHYEETPPLRLPCRPVQLWNGIAFGGARDVAADLAPLGGRPELDVGGYVDGGGEAEEQRVNWKIPIEVLLENYHAPYIHPGFHRFVDPASWTENDGAFDGERLMYQVMKPHRDFARNPGSPAFERWHQAILAITGGELPAFAAIVALYRPNLILEWWPFTFVATTYVPRTPASTLMTRNFCFDPRALARVPDYGKLVKEAWHETQRADDAAHEALQRGRRLLHRRDPTAASGYEVYQCPMEESVRMFHADLLAAVTPLIERPGMEDGPAPETGA